MGLAPPKPSVLSVSCNTWTESETPHGKPTTAMAGMVGYGRNAALSNQFQMVLMASQDAYSIPLG